ncbi:MAG: glutathionylspermidine synthase family protein [Clostridiaceae bacterium]|nr:glutathionylspermidine synthase family protein [Clostridiaceae bacterium]
MDMQEMLNEYLALAKSQGFVADFKGAAEYIRQSTATFRYGQLEFQGAPKMFTPEAYEVIEDAAETTAGILEKVIGRYLDDADYRKLFPFSEELEKLILLPAGYDSLLPISRLDIFFNEENFDFKFCEFNADGASAMNEDREIFNAWNGSKLWAKFGEKYRFKSFELFDSWVDTFMKIYGGYKKRVENPTVAIVDFLESATNGEFNVFKAAFLKRGINTVISEIRDLRFKSGALYTKDGIRIDAVYRRAVTSECMEKYDGIKDFIAAVKADAVCVIGAFRTQIIHNKHLFRILRFPETAAFLTAFENAFIAAHVPETYCLDEGCFDIDAVLKDKSSWLIKPADRYGSRGVATGGDFSHAEWEGLIREHTGQGFVLQRYCPPYKTTNIYCDKDGVEKKESYGNMTGMFVYDGKLAGLYSRQMTGLVTTHRNQGRVACSVIAEKKIVA